VWERATRAKGNGINGAGAPVYAVVFCIWLRANPELCNQKLMEPLLGVLNASVERFQRIGFDNNAQFYSIKYKCKIIEFLFFQNLIFVGN